MERRRFVFWVGFGLFSLGEKLRLNGLDKLAAATMQLSEPDAESSRDAEHWTAAENKTWRWFERETLVDGQWKLTGITTPTNKHTLERYNGKTGYLADDLVPAKLRLADPTALAEADQEIEPAPHQPSETRKARHGRPPSQWLRSLRADEIRTWLNTIEVPEAGVSGMTYWMHLTRDHSFDPTKLDGLNEDELAKLHAAAHFGY